MHKTIMHKMTVTVFLAGALLFGAHLYSVAPATAAQYVYQAKPRWADHCAFSVPCTVVSVDKNFKTTKVRTLSMCGGWSNRRGTKFTTKKG